MSVLGVRGKVGFRVLGASVAFTALAAMNAATASAGGPLAPMTYPAQVEQGQVFTISGTDCDDDAGTGGRAAGSWDGQSSDWSSFDVPADSDGNWSVQLTVPLDQTIVINNWDVECIDVPDTRFYPFTSLEILPAGSAPSSTTTTSTAPAASSTTTSTTSNPAAAGGASAAATPVAVRPAFTG